MDVELQILKHLAREGIVFGNLWRNRNLVHVIAIASSVRTQHL